MAALNRVIGWAKLGGLLWPLSPRLPALRQSSPVKPGECSSDSEIRRRPGPRDVGATSAGGRGAAVFSVLLLMLVAALAPSTAACSASEHLAGVLYVANLRSS